MPFVEGQKHRVWMAATQKCLVLKKDGSVTFAGERGEDGTLEKARVSHISSYSLYLAW